MNYLINQNKKAINSSAFKVDEYNAIGLLSNHLRFMLKEVFSQKEGFKRIMV
jgi:hypothetical protein